MKECKTEMSELSLDIKFKLFPVQYIYVLKQLYSTRHKYI